VRSTRALSLALIAALVCGLLLVPAATSAAAPGVGSALVGGKVKGELKEPGGASGAARAADAAAGTFEGEVRITKIHSRGGKLTADGVLEGTARPTKGPQAGQTVSVRQEFKNQPLGLRKGDQRGATLPDLEEAAAAPAEGEDELALASADQERALTALAMQQGNSCDILSLFLGPVFLDLLGLQVLLAPVILLVTALSGDGQLLGILLCAVAHLLDPTPAQQQLGLLNQLLVLINQLLGG